MLCQVGILTIELPSELSLSGFSKEIFAVFVCSIFFLLTFAVESQGALSIQRITVSGFEP